MTHNANPLTEYETLCLGCGSDSSVTYPRLSCGDISGHQTDIKHCHSDILQKHPGLCNSVWIKVS